MAGVQDPREEEVVPVEPDFSLTMDNSEVGATYEVALLSLMELFYQDIQAMPPEELYTNIDSRVDLLYEDIIAIMTAMLPAILLIGITDALLDIFKDMNSERYLLTSKEKEQLTKNLEDKIKPDNKYGETEQKLTIKGILSEVKNDLKTSAYFIKHRQQQEPNSKVKSGVIIQRAVYRIKRMVIHGVMTSYNTGKKAYYEHVYTNETKYDWITKHDDKVCSFCTFFEANGPYTINELPPCPYHLHCRCTFKPTNGSKMKLSFINIIKNIMEG